MPEQLHIRVEACFAQAEAFFKRPFARPEVSLRLRGQKAGVAHLNENRLRFNAQLYAQNREDFLRQTVAHEVAHLIAHQLFGHAIQPHGKEWQAIMRGVYGLSPTRCHSYAVPTRRANGYIYLCQCLDNNEFPLSPQRHALIGRGRRYFCRRCRETLRFSGRRQLD